MCSGELRTLLKRSIRCGGLRSQSLSFLQTVVAGLCKQGGIVVWRNASLTRLLEDSLGGNTKSSILVCLRTEDDSLSETIATLRFAVQAHATAPWR